MIPHPARQALVHWTIIAGIILASAALGALWLAICWPIAVIVLTVAAGAAGRLAWLAHRYPNDGGDWPP